MNIILSALLSIFVIVCGMLVYKSYELLAVTRDIENLAYQACVQADSNPSINCVRP